MHHGDEERERESEVFGVEHPFVVLLVISPLGNSTAWVRMLLTTEIQTEKMYLVLTLASVSESGCKTDMYHREISVPLTITFLMNA